MKRRDRVRCAALRHHVACATFAATTLGGHAEFELNFVESHARARMPCDFAIRDPAADANDHGEKQLAGCEDSIQYKYESVAFANDVGYPDGNA